MMVVLPTVGANIPLCVGAIVSGNDTPDKMEKTGWTLVKSETVDAPVIDELPITLECRLEEMNQYDQTYRVVAEIVNVLVDDSVLTEEGTVDATKLQAISYDPSTHAYLKLGSPVGQACEDGKKIN